MHAPPHEDDAARATRLGVSAEAVALCRACDLIDLHIDTFIPPRLWGYDPATRHKGGPFGGRFFGHLDLPRMAEGHMTGAMWSITTNPFRSANARWRIFQANLDRLRDFIARTDGIQLATDHAGYEAARAAGQHVAMIAIQGGNAVEAAPEGALSIPDDVVVRITLVHLTNAAFGGSSTPYPTTLSDKGLTDAGRTLVEQLNAKRIFVDLAHIHPDAFWGAVEAHDKSQPLIDTHTGVDGVRKHWRNLDDDQIKAIADTGGTIGIIFADNFLRRRGGPTDGAMIVEHMQHIIDVAGDDFVSVGSDYDGAIIPPRDLRGGETYPRLVQHMLNRGWDAERVQKVLGGNFLRAFRMLRPGAAG